MDLASVLPKSTQFVGTDITSYYFPPSPPPNIHFVKQSVTEEWPSDWHASFDVVHQKLVLSACEPISAQKVVDSLFSLTKPGGWIQLLECDHSGGFSPEQASRYPATVRFGELVMRCRAATGKSGQYGLSLRSWLREAGARDVVETLLNCPVGALAPTKEMKQSTTENLLSVVRGLKAARGGMTVPRRTRVLSPTDRPLDIPGLDLDANYFDQLHDNLQHELYTIGSFQRFHLVYGRRSLNAGAALSNGNGI
ncbi:uncharacterized protein PG998_014944 [Apiospora kogelbergensis]|uniref:uncharacterized protein n=1 Tax=Apiospora kogelbergensis TaxID=1337665 RepID=UPI0031323D02